MTATFEIKINAIRTGTVGELENVIKRVEFTVKGTEAGQTFELPQHIDLTDPETDQFIPLAEVTEAEVITWIETAFTNMAAVKAHIQYVIDRDIVKAGLTSAPLPWATTPVEPITPPTP